MQTIACPNCGAEMDTLFCGRCGQKRQGRLTYKGVFASIYDAIFDFESPFLKSVVQLTINPGKVYREYLDGARVRYFSPIRYSFWVLALMIATAAFKGVDPKSLFGVTISNENTGTNASDASALIHFSLIPLSVLLAICLAGVTRLFFRQQRYTALELFIPYFLSIGHFSLLTTALLATGLYSPGPQLLGLMLLSLIYMTWGIGGLYQCRKRTYGLIGLVAVLGYLIAIAVIIGGLFLVYAWGKAMQISLVSG